MMKSRGMGAVNPAKFAKGGKVRKYAEGRYVEGEPDENGVPTRKWVEEPTPPKAPPVEIKKPSLMDRMKKKLSDMVPGSGSVKKHSEDLQKANYAKGGSTFGTPFDGKSPFKGKHAPFGSKPAKAKDAVGRKPRDPFKAFK